MANEITKTVLLRSSKSGSGVDSSNGGSATKQFNQTGINSGKVTQLCTTAADVAIATPASVGTPRDLLVKNLDTTHYIELSIGTGGAFAAGRFSVVQPNDSVTIQPIGTVYMKANTADCAVEHSSIQA